MVTTHACPVIFLALALYFSSPLYVLLGRRETTAVCWNCALNCKCFAAKHTKALVAAALREWRTGRIVELNIPVLLIDNPPEKGYLKSRFSVGLNFEGTPE